MSNIVAIVGRPNVGKSTLFNRLIGKKKAIVHDISGITRDRQYGAVDWNGKEFTVIDTGGYVANSEDVFEAPIRTQVNIAIEEAAVILFMVDVSTEITDMDERMAKLLRKIEKPVLTVVNKVDNSSRDLESNNFYRLGIKDLFSISAISGSGTGDLLDKVVELLKEEKKQELSNIPKFAIVGRPNVGKSSFLNVLIGQERNIVTEIAGTTRDSIHTQYTHFGKDFLLIDTAGIRKKGKVKENIEFYSVLRAISAIEEADVCFILLDATRGIESQDINIVHLAESRKKGVVILVNKWDLVEKDTNLIKEYENKIRKSLSPFVDFPIVFISSLTKQRIFKAVETGLEIYKNRQLKIATSKLNNLMLDIIKHTPPPSFKGKFIKIKYVTQIKSPYPNFAFFCNFPMYIKEPYKRFLENKLRENFSFTGVPLILSFRKK